jgi:hypothetical protein
MTITSEREELHDLVDKLPDSEVPAARRFLRYLYNMAEDPVLRAAMNAPLDDEPFTPEQRVRVREAEAEADRGEVVRLEDLARELGL